MVPHLVTGEAAHRAAVPPSPAPRPPSPTTKGARRAEIGEKMLAFIGELSSNSR